MPKLMTAREAAALVKDGDAVVAEGFTFGQPEELFIAMEESFLQTGHPRDLTVVAPGGTSNTKGSGFDHFANEGMARRHITSYIGLTRKMSQLVMENKVEGYMWPLSVFPGLLRQTGAGGPGMLTHIGLRTFVDPRLEGGRVNTIATSADFIPDVVTLNDREWLYFKPLRIDAALVRGTTADEDGNVTFEREAGLLNPFILAIAARRCGGRVIVQVERVAGRGTLKPKDVRLPGFMVDAVVVSKPENHWQTLKSPYDPARSGEIRIPAAKFREAVFDYRKVVGKRGALELRPGMVLGLGTGMSEFVASVVWEEGVDRYLTFCVEAGIFGGVPGAGLHFNTVVNAAAIMDQGYMMEFFAGGGCDASLLGFGQIDSQGNVNTSRLGKRPAGIGGFLDLTTSTKRRIHCGAFTAGAQDIRVEDGKIRIVQDGPINKFINQVNQVTISGQHSLDFGQQVLVITERAVLEWTDQGLMLTEIAPGVDLERDVLGRMDFAPIVSPSLREMPAHLFIDQPLGLLAAWQASRE